MEIILEEIEIGEIIDIEKMKEITGKEIEIMDKIKAGLIAGEIIIMEVLEEAEDDKVNSLNDEGYIKLWQIKIF